MATTVTPKEVNIDRLAVSEMPWEPYRDRRGHEQLGVHHKLLWDEKGKGYAGLLKFDPAAELERHTHRFSEHYVWVVEGGCVIGEHFLQAGSFSHVPAGVEHGVDRAGPEGCTLFYLYLRA
ncbi:MAG: cupin domain-containing protein [Actinomycetota bacterium]